MSRSASYLKERVEVEVVGLLCGGKQGIALPPGAGEPFDEELTLLVEIMTVVDDRLRGKSQTCLGRCGVMGGPHGCVETARRQVHEVPAGQPDVVGRGEPCVVTAERLDELVLRPERQAAHGGMRAVGADYEIGAQRSAVREGDVDAVVVSLERRNTCVEAIFDGVLRGLVQHVDEVAAKDLQLGHQPVAVEGGDRHLGAAAAVGRHPGNAVLFEGAVSHLRREAHALDDLATGAA
jgi:hypothetical protein